MKHIGNTLYKIIEEKGLVKRTIANNCGINPSYFSQMLLKPSMDAAMLEKICREIDISPGYLFDDWNTEKYKLERDDSSCNSNKELKDSELKVELMKQLLEEKERVIRILSAKSGIEM